MWVSEGLLGAHRQGASGVVQHTDSGTPFQNADPDADKDAH